MMKIVVYINIYIDKLTLKRTPPAVTRIRRVRFRQHPHLKSHSLETSEMPTARVEKRSSSHTGISIVGADMPNRRQTSAGTSLRLPATGRQHSLCRRISRLSFVNLSPFFALLSPASRCQYHCFRFVLFDYSPEHV